MFTTSQNKTIKYYEKKKKRPTPYSVFVLSNIKDVDHRNSEVRDEIIRLIRWKFLV